MKNVLFWAIVSTSALVVCSEVPGPSLWWVQFVAAVVFATAVSIKVKKER